MEKMQFEMLLVTNGSTVKIPEKCSGCNCHNSEKKTSGHLNKTHCCFKPFKLFFTTFKTFYFSQTGFFKLMSLKSGLELELGLILAPVGFENPGEGGSTPLYSIHSFHVKV